MFWEFPQEWVATLLSPIPLHLCQVQRFRFWEVRLLVHALNPSAGCPEMGVEGQARGEIEVRFGPEPAEGLGAQVQAHAEGLAGLSPRRM